MKSYMLKVVATVLLGCAVMSSCSIMNNTTGGYVAGSVGGTILGAGIGAALGGNYGADVGSHIGMVVGGVAGAAIGADQDEKIYAQRMAVANNAQNNETAPTEYYDKNTGVTYKKVSDKNAILFSSRSTSLDDKSRKEIIKIAAALQNMPFSRIVIYGSTDDSESRDYSYELSEERAKAVADYFIGLGFNPHILSVVGLADKSPLEDNSSYSGRAANRCVEVYIEKDE